MAVEDKVRFVQISSVKYNVLKTKDENTLFCRQR